MRPFALAVCPLVILSLGCAASSGGPNSGIYTWGDFLAELQPYPTFDPSGDYGPSENAGNVGQDFVEGYQRAELDRLERQQRAIEYQQREQQIQIDHLEIQRKQQEWRRYEADMNRRLTPQTPTRHYWDR